MDRDFQNFIEEFSKISIVESIALGGSYVNSNVDDFSDYDIYIYTTETIPLITRETIFEKYCHRLQMNNQYWELGDEAILDDSGTHIDVMYRNLVTFENSVKEVVLTHQSHNGYTTCMWNNLLKCKVLFDRNNLLNDMKDRYNIAYPKELKENIINHNLTLLTGKLFSYDVQIKKAIARKDIISINHRITEFLASYFDIIFALNELTHAGEKRLISVCKSTCKILPNNFEKNIINLLKFKYNTNVIIEDIILELKKIL